MSYCTDAFHEFTERFGISTDPYGISISARTYQSHLKFYKEQFGDNPEAMAAFEGLPEFFAAVDAAYYRASQRIVSQDDKDIFTAEQFTAVLGFFNEKFGSPQDDWEIKLLGKAFERLQHTRRSATKKDVLLSREVNVAIHTIQLLILQLHTLEEAGKTHPDPAEFDRLVKESSVLEKSFLIRVIHDLSDELLHEVNVASEGKSTPIDIHYSLGYFYLKREVLENPPVDGNGNTVSENEVQAFLDHVAEDSKAIHYWKNKERYIVDALAKSHEMRSSDFKKFYRLQLQTAGYAKEEIKKLINLELKNPVAALIAAWAKIDDRTLGTLEASSNRVIEPSALPIVKKPQDIAVEKFKELISYFQNNAANLTNTEATNLGKLISALVLAEDIQNSRATNDPLVPDSDIPCELSLNIPEEEYLAKPMASAWRSLFWNIEKSSTLAAVFGYCIPVIDAQRVTVIKQQQALQDIIKFNMESSPVSIAHTVFDKMQQVGPQAQITAGSLYVLAAMCDESLKPVLEAISPHLENTMSVLRPWKDPIQEWAGIIAGGGSLATMPAMFKISAYHRSPFGFATALYTSKELFEMMTHPDRAGELGKFINVCNWAWNITRNMGECDPKVSRHKPIFNGSITENVLDIIPTTISFANKEAKRFITYGLQPLQHYIAEKATIAGTSTSQIKNPFNKVATATTEVAGSIAKDIKRIVVPPRIHTYHASDDEKAQYITNAAKFSAAINVLAIGSAVLAHTTNNPTAITVAQLLAISTAVTTSVQGRVKLLPDWDLAGKFGGVGQALLLGGVEAPGLALTFLSYYLFSKGNAAMLGKQGKDSR
ncbi:MAG: hypothetical protein ACK59C_01135 [Holosporales bacterium]|jgi:hypothetical protein